MVPSSCGYFLYIVYMNMSGAVFIWLCLYKWMWIVILHRSSIVPVFWYGALPPIEIGCITFTFLQIDINRRFIGLKKIHPIGFPLGIFPIFFFLNEALL